MKKGFIAFLVFILVLAVTLYATGSCNNKFDLTIDATNTAVTITTIQNDEEVKIDAGNNVLKKNQEIKITVDFDKSQYELTTLKINNESILENLIDNTHTLTCQRDIKIEAVAEKINTKLTVTSICSIVEVFDETGTQINNGSKLILGNTYTLTVTPSIPEYILATLTLNNLNILPNLIDNTYTFVCNGVINVEAVSEQSHYLTFLYKGSIGTHYVLFGLGGITSGYINIYDEQYNLVATLEKGESYNYIVYGNTYTVEFVRTGGTGYAGLKYGVANENVFVNCEYWNGEKFENVTHSFDFRMEYWGWPTDVNYVGNDAITITDIDNNQVWDLTIGETYTIHDITPEGYKVVLSQEGQNLALPHTFVYTEDLRFDIDIVETTTITFNFANIESILIENLDTLEIVYLDLDNGTATAELELGIRYCAGFYSEEGYNITKIIYNATTEHSCNSSAVGIPFTASENGTFEVITQAATITPAVTINGYNADFANIGVIKYRTDYSSPNYIYDNLTLGESYYIQVDIFANASTDYYISAIYVNGTLLGSGDSTTSTLEVGRFEVNNPLNIVVEIGSK